MITFDERWDALTPDNEPVFQRVDDTHKLNFYFGKDVNGDRTLSLICADEPPDVTQSQAISVTGTKRNDGRWILVFRLTKPGLEKVFRNLCEDLVESSRNIPESITGASFVIARFTRWQKLLEKARTGIMEEHSLRGLLGELVFLEKAILSFGRACSVHAWIGPTGSSKDFIYENSWYEIKTVQPNATSVMISSENQLDGCINNGCLVIVTLQKCETKSGSCFSPADMIMRIKDVLKSEPLAETEFEEKLLEAGYMEHQDYREKFYRISGMKYYSIEEDFPKITTGNLPAGVRNVSYEIEIRAIHAYEKII